MNLLRLVEAPKIEKPGEWNPGLERNYRIGIRRQTYADGS